jgi:hypothetical protein
MIIWDPDKSGINDEINIVDYLGPTRKENQQSATVYASREPRKQVAEAKGRKK